ncbi:MAG: hypothetical protein ABS942_15865 [Solibacillus sp.]
MISSILMMNLEPSPNNNSKQSSGNSFIEVAKIVMSKANFTRGQWFYFGFLVLYLAFFTIIAISPTIVYIAALFTERELSEIKPPIPLNNLLNGLYVVLGVGLLYFILYSFPELRDRYNTKRKSNT